MANEREAEFIIRAKDLSGEAFKKVQSTLRELGVDVQHLSAAGVGSFNTLGGSIGRFGAEAPGKLSLVDRAAVSLRGSLGTLASGFAIGSLIDRGIAGLASWTSEAIASAGATVDLSNKTGLSTETIQRMAFVAKQTGTDVDTFTTAATNLGVKLAGGGASVRASIEAVGLSFDQLRSKKPDEQFTLIADALGKIEDPQERNRRALEIFGSRAKDLLPAISEGYSDIAREASVASDDQVRAIDRASDRWGKFVEQLKTGVTAALGSGVEAVEQVAEMTATQRIKHFTLLLAGQHAEAAAYRASLMAVAEGQKSIGEAAVAAAPAARDFVAELAAARKEVGELSPATLRQIAAARQLGASSAELSDRFGVEAAHLRVIDETQRTAATGTREHTRAQREQLSAASDLVERGYKTLVEQQRKALTELPQLRANLQQNRQQLLLTIPSVRDWAAANNETTATLQAMVAEGRAFPTVFKEQIGTVQRLVGEQGTWRDGIGDLTGALTTLGSIGSGAFQSLTTAAGSFIDQLVAATKAGHGFAKTTWTQKAGALVAGAAGIIAGTGQGSTGQRAASGAMAGAQAGIPFAAATGGLSLAIGAGVGALTGWLRGRSQGRDAVKKFVEETFGDFEKLHAKLNELPNGEELWVGLTQRVGRGNADQAAAAIEAVTAALERHKQKQIDTANTTVKAAEAQAAAHQKVVDEIKGRLDGLNAEYDQLWNSIKDEAPEEEIGVVEKLTRERMASVAAQREMVEKEMAAAQDQLTESLERVAKAIEDTAAALATLTGQDWNVTVKTNVQGPPGIRSTEPDGDVEGSFARGGVIGHDQVARVHGGEIVGPVSFMREALVGAMRDVGGHTGAAARPTVVQLMVDRRILGEVTLQAQRDTLGVYGVR